MKNNNQESTKKCGVSMKDKKNHWVILVVALLIFFPIGFFVQQHYFNRIPEVIETTTTEEGITTTIIEISTASEEVSTATESTTITTETTTQEVAQVLEQSEVQKLFRDIFNNVQGNHSLYYQEIGKGEEQNIPALIIQNKQIRAASVIKIFILAALYQQSEEGLIDLDEVHVLTEEEKVGGTGSLQNQPAGTEWTFHQLAHLMIAESDNTASNIIIEKLGGLESTQAMIHKLGYKETELNRKFLDMDALSKGIDNYINAKDVGELLEKLYRRELISVEASDDMLEQFKGQHYRDKLLFQLPSNVVTYNKTGMFDEYGVQSDAAIIVTEKGAFVVAVLSEGGNAQEQNAALNQFGKELTELFINQAN